MHLVDDLNTGFTLSGSEVDFFTDITDVFNTVVTCGVDFGNVNYCAVVNTLTDIALITGITVNGMKADDRL